jgi:hypothetical protein
VGREVESQLGLVLQKREEGACGPASAAGGLDTFADGAHGRRKSFLKSAELIVDP